MEVYFKYKFIMEMIGLGIAIVAFIIWLLMVIIGRK